MAGESNRTGRTISDGGELPRTAPEGAGKTNLGAEDGAAPGHPVADTAGIFWLVYRDRVYSDDVLSIWTDEEHAEAARAYYEAKNPSGFYRVRAWRANELQSQWD